ncbi:MAG: gamma-glutamyltransferase [Candidatus Solibacter usitatus]|nr:gamma-glutamyltransferase [Candidatus Solibacter usitatus]
MSKRILLLPLLLASSLSAQQNAPPRTQARSVVMTKYGIVATSQTLASAAGVKVLEAGGNAIDAAIAANAAIGLMEPTSNGLGGDLFAIVYEAKTGKIHGLNASGWAPSGLTVDLLEAKGNKTMPQRGIYSVTVPGVVSGWDMLRRRFGTMPFSRILAPVIHYADEGFPVTEIIASGWRGSTTMLAAHANSKATYLPNGRAPRAGEIFRNSDLAATLRRIAQRGRDGFYTGPTAEAILKISAETGGTFTAADLAEFQGEWVEPISTTYRGWQVYELPPNGQGIAALMMLNIMERFPLPEYGHNTPRALHVMIEAKKLAYADMLRYTADPRFFKAPIEQMTSRTYAERRAASIDTTKAACTVLPADLAASVRPGADTIYMTVTDKDGNMISLIQSNYAGFGSGLVPPGTGFMLQNRGALFTLDRAHPNALAPRKRPLHTIIPAFMQKDGTRIAFGIMGGWNQAQAHAQFVSNVADFNMNVQAALEMPRFTKATFEGCDVELESRIDPASVAALKSLGHAVKVVAPYSGGSMGGGQATMRDPNGVTFGGSDPRKDGAAVPQTPRIPDL